MSSTTEKSVAERSMGLGLRALNRLAGSDLLDRIGVRKQVERVLFQGTTQGFRSATAASRTFKAAQKLGKPARQPHSKAGGLFDLTPDDEQQMLQEAFSEFAAEQLRPVALQADADCATPAGAARPRRPSSASRCSACRRSSAAWCSERSAVTSVLSPRRSPTATWASPYAALAPAAVATALGLWGDADQQATYLPAFVGEDVPAAALALLEPRPLFDPFELDDHGARKDGGDFVLDGVKSLVAARRGRRAVRRRRARRGHGPALFLVESTTDGLSVEAEPAMGLRAAATGRLLLEGVRLPAGALLGDGEPAVYAECVHRARLAWCALAVGTAQAVLDYVIPYVNERIAFGEPISQPPGGRVHGLRHRASSSRACGWRPTAPRAAPTTARTFAREAAIARQLCADKGMRDRLRRRPAARRPRLRQGAPGRALVPRPACRRRHGGRPARLAERNDHDDQSRDPQEVHARSSARRTRSRARSSARSRASTTSPSTRTRRSSTCSRR